MNITDAELKMIEDCRSEQDWNNACDAVKRARNGQYPSDWWAKVMQSGLARRVMAKFGTTPDIKIIPIG